MPKLNKEIKFITHEPGSRTSLNLKIFQKKYGIVEAYAFYWILLEIISEQPYYSLEKNKFTYNAISVETGIEATIVEEMLEYAITECKLFDSDDSGKIYSERITEIAQGINVVKERNRKNGLKSAAKRNSA